jgi:hypothetical protein
VTGAHDVIDNDLNNNGALFGTSLPLVSAFGSPGVLDEFNATLDANAVPNSLARPGVVGVTGRILTLLLPGPAPLVMKDLPKDLQGFLPNLTWLLGVGRGLSSAEVKYLNLVHYLAVFNWSLAPPAAGATLNYDDWMLQYGEQLYRYFVDLFSGNFIDRNGNAVKFDLSASDFQTPAQLPQTIISNSPAIAGEMVSVLVEYLGDEVFQVPCSVNASGTPNNYQTYTCYRANVIQTYLGDPPPVLQFRLASGFDESPLVSKIIASASSAAQKQIASAAGGLVRGGGVAAVNNEVIAEVLSSLLGTLAKKFVEKACYVILSNVLNGLDDSLLDVQEVLRALGEIYGVKTLPGSAMRG